MKRTTFSISIAALGLVFAADPLAAHHAFTAEFDAQQPITLHGTVTKVEWTNPHAWINLDVKGDDGQVIAWRVEAGAPNALLRRGFTKNYLPPGAEIVVQGFKAKDGSNRANGSNVTTPDGKKLFLGSSGTGSPDDKKDDK
jgi:hypothetical protein